MEVLRVFVLTTAVLTTVIAFGAAIKPLAQDDLFSAGQIVRYVFAAMVPMLQYAIPVASAFAVTLVIHRMASDNEIVAAAVSGISYGRLLMPIASLGVALVVAMSALTHFVTPQFLRLLERMITHDVTLLFQTAIQRDQSFQVGDLQIYADELRVIDNPSDTEADTRMVLSRMAAAETDSTGRVTTDVTARQAVVDVFRVQDRTYMKLVLLDTMAYNAQSGELVSTAEIRPERAIVLPSAFRNSLETRTTLEMFQLRAQPDLFAPVANLRDGLAEALRDEALTREIRQQLSATGMLRLVSGPNSFDVRAGSFDGVQLRGSAGQPVEITQYQNGRERYRFLAQGVELSRSRSALQEHPNLDVTLLQHDVIDATSGSRNTRARLNLVELELQGMTLTNLDGASSGALLELAQPMRDAAPETHSFAAVAVRRAAESLERRMNTLQSDVVGRTAQRIALACIVVLYLLAGMILSMLMRGATPLAIYSIVFAPSILSMMLIFGGTEVMRDGHMVAGGIVMWSGHAVMLGLCVWGFQRLVRN